MYLAPLSTLPVSHWQNQLSIQAQEVGRQVLAAPSLYISRAVVVQLLSCVQLFASGLRHSRLPCPSPSPIFIISKSCPQSGRCHPTRSSCHPFLLLPSVVPSLRVFSNESALHIKWPKYWSFSFSISPSKEYSGLISWFYLLAVQGTLKSLFQHHSSKASIL